MRPLHETLAAWALSLLLYPPLLALATGMDMSGRRLLEGMLGVGVILLLPSLLAAWAGGFAMRPLRRIRPAWALPPACAAAFAAALGLLGLGLPAGWGGAALFMAGYGATLGLVWGGLAAISRSTTSIAGSRPAK